MIPRHRLHLALLSSGLCVTALTALTALVSSACGGISDPTKGGADGRVATVSGALTGITVPANARVALVYRKVTTTSAGSSATVEVGSDVPVIAGKFTMSLGTPADAYFSSIDGTSISNASSPPPSVEVPSPATSVPPPSSGTSTSGSPGAFGAARLSPRDLVGGSITEPLTAAMAGFVVYADTNGNGKLDLEGQYASSPDQVLGGNKELILVYLKGGGSLDYEKLRDKSGILPTAGFDLAWTEGRWLPLSEVELKLSTNAQLPSSVCDQWVSSSGSGSASAGDIGGSTNGGTFSADGGSPTTSVDGGPSSGSSGSNGAGSSGGSSGSSGSSSSGGFGSAYPSPSDPNLHCSPDGRSYAYGGSPTSTTCPPSPPPPTGLCAGDVYATPTACISGGSFENALAPGAPVPDGWPCPTSNPTPVTDAGLPATDAGAFDGG